MMKSFVCVNFAYMIFSVGVTHGQIYGVQSGNVTLSGKGSDEIIKAESSSLDGRFNLISKGFHFEQALEMFCFSHGNGQKKYADENYWETGKFSKATFTGEIINDIDLSRNGTFKVTAKGRFNIHGVTKPIKIPAVVTITNGMIVITSKFSIYLSDYNIKILQLLSHKVSDEFEVEVSMRMAAVNF
jgi:hypothetical protein